MLTIGLDAWTYFLLRIEEALSLGGKNLSISSGNVVKVQIAMSKMDQECLGIDRRAKCVCKAVRREPPTAAPHRPGWGSLVCPYHEWKFTAVQFTYNAEVADWASKDETVLQALFTRLVNFVKALPAA